MSYDITLNINTGIEDYPVADCGNYTYNISGMHEKAMGYRLSQLNGKSVKDIIPILREGIKQMQDNPEVYKAMNPENGWGNYEGALAYLQTILDNAVKHPATFLDVH
jgi:hypothetical protein